MHGHIGLIGRAQYWRGFSLKMMQLKMAKTTALFGRNAPIPVCMVFDMLIDLEGDTLFILFMGLWTCWRLLICGAVVIPHPFAILISARAAFLPAKTR